MKNSFRLFVGLGLCALLTVPALAAPTAGAPGAGKMGGRMGGGGGMRGGGMRGMGRMTEQLNLTDAQKAKMKTMMTAQRPAMKAIFDNKSLTEDQKRTKMRAMRAANMKKMAAILTPAQRKKMETMMKEQAARRGGDMKGKM